MYMLDFINEKNRELIFGRPNTILPVWSAVSQILYDNEYPQALASLATAEGKNTFVAQWTMLVNQLFVWNSENSAVTHARAEIDRAIDGTVESLNDRENGLFPRQSDELFLQMKTQLENILFALKNDGVVSETKKSICRALTRAMTTVCGPGIAENINQAQTELYSDHSLCGAWARLRFNIQSSQVSQFLHLNRNLVQAGSEIHYHTLANQYSRQFRLNIPGDESLIEDMFITDQYRERMNPEQYLRLFLHEYQHRAVQHVMDFVVSEAISLFNQHRKTGDVDVKIAALIKTVFPPGRFRLINLDARSLCHYPSKKETEAETEADYIPTELRVDTLKALVLYQLHAANLLSSLSGSLREFINRDGSTYNIYMPELFKISQIKTTAPEEENEPYFITCETNYGIFLEGKCQIISDAEIFSKSISCTGDLENVGWMLYVAALTAFSQPHLIPAALRNLNEVITLPKENWGKPISGSTSILHVLTQHLRLSRHALHYTPDNDLLGQLANDLSKTPGIPFQAWISPDEKGIITPLFCVGQALVDKPDSVPLMHALEILQQEAYDEEVHAWPSSYLCQAFIKNPTHPDLLNALKAITEEYATILAASETKKHPYPPMVDSITEGLMRNPLLLKRCIMKLAADTATSETVRNHLDAAFKNSIRSLELGFRNSGQEISPLLLVARAIEEFPFEIALQKTACMLLNDITLSKLWVHINMEDGISPFFQLIVAAKSVLAKTPEAQEDLLINEIQHFILREELRACLFEQQDGMSCVDALVYLLNQGSEHVALHKIFRYLLEHPVSSEEREQWLQEASQEASQEEPGVLSPGHVLISAFLRHPDSVPLIEIIQKMVKINPAWVLTGLTDVLIDMSQQFPSEEMDRLCQLFQIILKYIPSGEWIKPFNDVVPLTYLMGFLVGDDGEEQDLDSDPLRQLLNDDFRPLICLLNHIAPQFSLRVWFELEREREDGKVVLSFIELAYKLLSLEEDGRPDLTQLRQHIVAIAKDMIASFSQPAGLGEADEQSRKDAQTVQTLTNLLNSFAPASVSQNQSGLFGSSDSSRRRQREPEADNCDQGSPSPKKRPKG